MPRLLRAVVRTAAVAGTATAVSNRVSRRQAGRWADQGTAQAPPAPAPAPAVAPAPAPAAAPVAGTGMSNTIEELKQLGDLRDQGVLSETEFAAQKAKVLEGP